MRHSAWLAGLSLLAAAHGTAQGQGAPQGIDCTKARSPTEKAICASPALLSLDRQSALAYTDALARQPENQAARQQDLLRWLKARDTACALPSREIPECLRTQLTARLAALAPPAAATAAATTAASPAATPTPTPTPVPTQVPTQVLVTDAPLPEPPDPAIPATTLPIAAATLDQASLPATLDGETLLLVTAPGRFAITVKSPGGTALQLIDMLAGPREVMGIPGSQDGRVDALLDVGTYKIRTTVAEKASGTASLTVTPFRDAAPPRTLPAPGRLVQDTLQDGQQRAFWFALPAPGPVRIEAAGRSLADLRIWRDGRELVALEPTALVTEPVPGHGLTDLRLDGKLEAGTYLAIAYGGPPTTWTDNDKGQPFLLRAGLSPALELGWAGGPMGPFGSEVYEVPPTAALLRLRLPSSAAAQLIAGDTAGNTVELDRRSRDPVVSLFIDPGYQHTVEVRATAGQAFTLRALTQPGTVVIGSATLRSPVWLSAIANGTGGDDVPPIVLVQRYDNTRNPARIVADTLPRLTPGGWRTRFNIHSRTTLLAQATGPVVFRSTGLPVELLGTRAPLDLSQGGIADLPAGTYSLTMTPQFGGQGAVELLAAPPGVSPPPAQAWPPDPVLPLGIQPLDRTQRLVISGVRAPGVALGLSARPVPVALAEGPLAVTLAAGAGITVPVATPPGTTLSVTEIGQGAIPYARNPGTARDSTDVVLPPADHPRTVVLAARRPVVLPPIPAPGLLAASPPMQAGIPGFFDLVRDQQRTFNLVVPEGGLFRVETLGRLHTSGTLGTAFLPGLATAEANGIGENMLIQHVLRAGRYRVTVKAQDSAGRAGLLAAPAPLLTLGTLVPGGSVRTTLPSGTGAAIPLVIETSQTVHLDIASLGDPWAARLEDAEGWPLATPGPLDGTEHKLPAGHYRLLVEPAATTRQAVVRLSTVPPPAPPITGHGPHPLPFAAPQSAVWREPESQSAPRTPDTWTFVLAGDADVKLTLPDTMIGTLRSDTPGTLPQRIVKRWTGPLPAGTYTLEVAALGRNDRAPYAVSLTSPSLQPGVPRRTTLPATIPFAVAAPRVVSLTTFGTIPVKAVLRGSDGAVLGRYAARMDDWNIAVSRPLPAGAYTLELSAASTPTTSDRSGLDAPSSTSAGNAGDSSGESLAGGSSGDTPGQAGTDQAQADTPTSDNMAPNGQDAQTLASQLVPRPAKGLQAAAAPSDDASDTAAPIIEVRLSLPEATAPIPASTQATPLPGAGVHVLTLDAPSPGSLVVAAAQSDAPLVLALERRSGDTWAVVATDEGRTPVLAVPADSDPSPWRAEIWAVDGGTEPVRAAVRTVTPEAQPPASATLTALDGMPAPLAVGRVRLAEPGLLHVDAHEGLRTGGWPGHPLLPLSGAAVLPEGQDVWLIGPPGRVEMAPLALDAGQEVALTVPDGLTATLPAFVARDGAVVLWRARSGTGQPSLGPAMGYAPGTAVALAGPPVPLRAAEAGPLRLSLRQDRLALLPAQAVDGVFHVVLAPGTALPVTMSTGDKGIDAVLPPGTAAIPDWRSPHAAAWSGDTAAVRTLTGNWTTLLLANTGTTPAPVSLSIAPALAASPLKPGTVQKRFFGAAGSFEVTAEGTAGARLHVAGSATLAAITGDGRVVTGTEAASPGPSRVIVTHGAGAVALWMDAPGASPWPDAAAQPAALPSRMTLSGAAMAFKVSADAPLLLHAATTAPVLLDLGGTEAPALFPSGAELHRIVPAGGATLRVLPASDGPLTGTLDLRAEPVMPVMEGLGAAVSVPPGGGVAFGFTVARATPVGIGVQTDAAGTMVRLLDATGHVMGQGVAMLVTLQPGRYVLEALVPPDGGTAVLRPAIVGIAPRPAGPPPDVVRDYLELAGMKPQGTAP